VTFAFFYDGDYFRLASASEMSKAKSGDKDEDALPSANHPK
jgi:hypothetical protein